MPTLPVTLFMVKLLSIHLKMQLAMWTRSSIPLSPQLPVGNSRQDKGCDKQVTCVWCARQNCDFLSSFAEFSRVSRIQSLLKSENDSPLRSKKSWIH